METKRQILILDEDEDSRILLFDLLTHEKPLCLSDEAHMSRLSSYGTSFRAGFDAVIHADDEFDTLGNPDLILLNLRTPDMNFRSGLLKLQRRAEAIPILILASYFCVEESARELCRQIDFATHPIGPSDLGLLVLTVLGCAEQLNGEQSQTVAELSNALKGLVHVIDARDSYTDGHAERVQEWCKQAAALLSFEPTDCETLHWLSLLHDVCRAANEKTLFGLIKAAQGLPLAPDVSTWYEAIRDVLVRLDRVEEGFGHYGDVYLVTGGHISGSCERRTLFELIAAVDLLDIAMRGNAYLAGKSYADVLTILKQKGVFDPTVLQALAEVSLPKKQGCNMNP